MRDFTSAIGYSIGIGYSHPYHDYTLQMLWTVGSAHLIEFLGCSDLEEPVVDIVCIITLTTGYHQNKQCKRFPVDSTKYY
jgi:hypothetical protein